MDSLIATSHIFASLALLLWPGAENVVSILSPDTIETVIRWYSAPSVSVKKMEFLQRNFFGLSIVTVTHPDTLLLHCWPVTLQPLLDDTSFSSTVDRGVG